MKRIGLFAAALLACAASAAGETPTVTETVVLPPYAGVNDWKKVTNVSNADKIYYEWIPADQPVQGFKDILTEQAFFKLKDVPAMFFADRLTQMIGADCQKASRIGPKAAVENGFNVVYAQTFCVHDKVKAQDVENFIKVIQGRSALWVFMREFHRPTEDGTAGARVFPKDHEADARAFADAMMAASDYLVKVQICPSADGSPCPSPGTAALKGAVPK